MTLGKTTSIKGYWWRFISRNRVTFSLFLLVIALSLVGQIISSGFLKFQHIGDMLRAASFLGIVAIGQTLVVLTGGIDLSVGPLITMGNVFICMLLNGLDANNLWAITLMILAGLFLGAVSGLGVAYLHISPLVMTLAVGSLVTGITLIYSKGAPKGLASPLLRQIGVRNILNSIPIVVIIWIALSIVIIAILSFSTYGRKIFYVGANEKAAYLSGIKVPLVKTIAYAISGVGAVFTGILMAGYTQDAFFGIGDKYIMWSIAAVVIGGTSLMGGKGGYLGTIAGAIILILLESILTLLHIPEAGRRIAEGIIILLMITIYFKKRGRR